MNAQETKHIQNSGTSDIKKEDLFEKQVEDSVNERVPLNLFKSNDNQQHIAQLFKITQKDLIAKDGTQLAAFVEADEHYEPFFNIYSPTDYPKVNNSERVSWSWPPPFKMESEGNNQLLSSYELI